MTELKDRIQALDQEIMEKIASSRELRRQLPRESVDDFVLQDADGPVRLSELFGDHADLIVIHNMGRSCPYCTLWADGFNGVLSHFENRCAFVMVSPDSPREQAEFCASRQWRFRMASEASSGFTAAMGFVKTESGKPMYWPGFSTFRREQDGSISRVSSDFFGPGDIYAPIWQMIALLADGAGDWQPKLGY